MRLRLDIAGVGFFCTRNPEPKVDFETGAVRTDRESGETLWRVQVAALDASGGEILTVTVPGEPEVAIGSPVQVKGLVAIPWSQGERSRGHLPGGITPLHRQPHRWSHHTAGPGWRPKAVRPVAVRAEGRLR